MIVFISVGFGALYDMYKKHIEFKERTLNHNNKADEKSIEMRKHIAALEERVQVLEKIVTDEGYQVHKEISKL